MIFIWTVLQHFFNRICNLFHKIFSVLHLFPAKTAKFADKKWILDNPTAFFESSSPPNKMWFFLNNMRSCVFVCAMRRRLSLDTLAIESLTEHWQVKSNKGYPKRVPFIDDGRVLSTAYKRPQTKKGNHPYYEYVYDEYYDCITFLKVLACPWWASSTTM